MVYVQSYTFFCLQLQVTLDTADAVIRIIPNSNGPHGSHLYQILITEMLEWIGAATGVLKLKLSTAVKVNLDVSKFM